MTDEETIENISDDPSPEPVTIVETDMTSDILLYNILRNTGDEYIQEFNIKFIDKSVPAEESNTIYIANVDLETRSETFHGFEYTALVNIFIKTKNTNYLEGSQYLRTCAKHLKNVLKDNVTCRKRHIRFRNLSYEYGSSYTLKGLHLLCQLNEWESKNQDPEFISQVVLDDVTTRVLSESEYYHEKNK